MRLFGQVDGAIYTADRAEWLSPPFDLSWRIAGVRHLRLAVGEHSDLNLRVSDHHDLNLAVSAHSDLNIAVSDHHDLNLAVSEHSDLNLRTEAVSG